MENSSAIQLIQWSAPEHEQTARNQDWFWALGVVVVTASTAAIIFGNYFFAALIILSGASLALVALKTPEMVNYEINDRGLKIRTNLYKFDSIHAYWIATHATPTLFIKSSRVFFPVISVPLPGEYVTAVGGIFKDKQIPEEEMHERAIEHMLEILGL